MSSSQMQTKWLRKKIVSADESDMNELKPRMIDHLRFSKPPCSTKLTTERESKKEAEFEKTSRSLCDQEQSNIQECTQFVVQASEIV